MLNSHCNNNDIKIFKINNKACGQLDANPRYTDRKTIVLLTMLRSSVLRIDKNICFMLKL